MMRTTQNPLPLILAMLSGLYFLLPHESFAQQYKLDLMAATGSLQAIDSHISLNDSGVVAFAATDSDTFSKLFVSSAPGTTPKAISFFASNRLFSTAAINNQIPAQVAQIADTSGLSRARVT